MIDKKIYECPGCNIELTEKCLYGKTVLHCKYCNTNFERCTVCDQVRSLWDRKGVCCACAMRKKYFNSNIQDEEIINLTEEVDI